MQKLITLTSILLLLATGLLAQCPQYDFSHLADGFVLDCDNSTIIVEAVQGGDPPVEILWTQNGNVLGTDVSIALNQPGNYNLIATGNDGCTENIPFQVTSTALQNLPQTLVLQGCPDDPEPTFCLATWNDDWTIEWSTGATGPCVQGLLTGTVVEVTITNLAGCMENLTLDVPDLFFEAQVTNMGPGSCEDALLLLEIFESPVSGGYSAIFIDELGNSYEFFTGDDMVFTFTLPPGNYTGFVNNAFGCTTPIALFAVEGSGVVIASSTITDVSCAGSTDGSIELVIEGGTSPYEFSWSNGSTSSVLTGLIAGTYAVTVNDAEGCATEGVFTVIGPSPLQIELLSNSPASCGGLNDGFLHILVSGGAGFYDYQWSNGWDTPNNNNLVAGDYSLTVTDQNGCSLIDTYTVETGFNALIDATNTGNITCLDDEVTLIANPGGPDYSYVWTGNGVDGFTTGAVTVTEPGIYTVLITSLTDPNCSQAATILVEEFTEPVQAFAIPNTDCETGLGTVQVNVSSGDFPISYELMQDGSTLLAGTASNSPFFLQNVPPDEYVLALFSDLSGCNLAISLVVEEANDFEAGISFDTIYCEGDLGNLTATPFGGAGPFNYLWNNGATTPTIENADPGFYCVTITDQAGCSASNCINNSIEPLFVFFGSDFASCGNPDGLALGQPFNGTPPYSIEWEDGTTDFVLSGVSAGTYSATVTDDRGCIFVGEATVEERIELAITTAGGGDGCEGEEVIVAATPVLDGYTYNWEGPNGFVFTGTSFTTSINGFYAVEAINDTSSCVAIGSVEISGAEGLLTGIEVDPESCSIYTTLTPQFSLEINQDLLTSSWVIPSGDTVPLIDGTQWFAVEPGLYIYLGDYAPLSCQVSDSVFLAEVGGECNGVSGRLWADEGNCMLDGTETPVPGWLVRIETDLGVEVAWVLTDQNGFFFTELPQGSYVAFASPWNGDLYYDCPDVQAFVVDAAGNAYVDVFMPYEEECVAMYVNVSAPILRRCFENNVYVYYCNDGPIVAEDATITVELDPFLIFLNSSPAPVSVDAHTVTYNLGDLPPFECGSITMNVLASCDAELGQIHCIEATATPNDPCPAPDDWNGANLTVQAECTGDSLIFTITNDGLAPLTEPFQYIVIEDGIMMMTSPITSAVLAAGESILVSVPANGSTYHFQTTQQAGNPGFDTPTLVVEGCGTNDQGTFTTGLVNLLPLGDASTDWFDIVCRDNTGSFDPNDKMGFPTGVSNRHFIEEGTTIAYDIQFQNTGTDTAFTVVIRDTIAPEFDLSTLRMGASSHDYIFEVDSNRTLTITFNDIMLPDSFVDVRGSQGVVSYTITHLEGIPLGTELRNQAAIYFDFNEPIFTSTTLHTLGEDFLSSLVEVGQYNEVPMTIYPNPVSKGRSINVQLPIRGAYHLEIYNGQGAKILHRSDIYGAQNIQLGRQPAGWYVARATRPDGSFIALERFIVE